MGLAPIPIEEEFANKKRHWNFPPGSPRIAIGKAKISMGKSKFQGKKQKISSGGFGPKPPMDFDWPRRPVKIH
jgi:hypothetical protein